MSAEGRDRRSTQRSPEGTRERTPLSPQESGAEPQTELQADPYPQLQDWLLDRSPVEVRELLRQARQEVTEGDSASPSRTNAELSSAELRLAQRWLDQAESCDELASELRWIETLAERVEGELIQRVSPERDLWPQIAERLEDPMEGELGASAESPVPESSVTESSVTESRHGSATVPRLGSRRAALSRSLTTGITRWVALAATLLIGTLLGLYLAERGDLQSVLPAGSQVLPAASGAEAELELLRQSRRQEQARRSLRELTASYDLLRQLLVKSLDDTEGGMSEETAELLRRELTAIDSSILELRDAIEQEPDNQLLHQLLLASYDQQLQLLRRAQELSYRL
ncbi:MAG: hypothetical protein AAGD01_12535 [Acidobacteriota bacterium]